MIPRDLAVRLREAGLPWSPGNGDRFIVPDRDLDDQVFVISDMVIETLDQPHGRMLAFNGTTEWALDSLEATEAIWLPREEQLRVALGESFVSLQLLPGPLGGYACSVLVDGTEQRYVDVDTEAAYARALLALLLG